MNIRSLFGVIALSPIMAVEAFAKEKPAGEPIPEATQIIIQGTKKKEVKPSDQVLVSDGDGGVRWQHRSTLESCWATLPQSDPTKQVSMAVGDDGNLWLKRKDGEWKRIVTE